MSVECRSTPQLRRRRRNAFHYTLLLTSVFSAKLLHLYSHLTSLPLLLYLLYLPTFLAVDVVNAAIFWAVVHLSLHGRWNILMVVIRYLFSFMILGAASIQIAFFMETGGEIKWKAAKSLTSDPDGFKVALTGAVQAMFVAILLVAIAFTVSQPAYNASHRILLTGIWAFGGNDQLRQLVLPTESKLPINTLTLLGDLSDSDDEICLTTRDSLERTSQRPDMNEEGLWRLWHVRLMFIAPLTIVCTLLSVRPPHFPYSHMSTSLPFTLTELWNPFDMDICEAGNLDDFPRFPFTQLLREEFWERSSERNFGWRPIANMNTSYQKENQLHRPSWLPAMPIQGFEKWYLPRREMHPGKGRFNSPGHDFHPPQGAPKHHGGHHQGVHPHPHYHLQSGKSDYNPITDPMRITNLNQALLPELSQALKEREIKIKHIVLLALESTRKDVFPLKQGSHLYEKIIGTNDRDTALLVQKELSKLTRNAEILTGESGFPFTANRSSSPQSWRTLPETLGGLNIQGAMTGSTTSLKSMLGSHCGVQPLAVDFTVEAGRQIYQPCIPSILRLLNTKKENRRRSRKSEEPRNKFTQMPWRSVYVQAITDQFDHQDMINDQIGFDELVVKKTLVDPQSRHFPPKEQQSNYFGFPETQVKPYIRDAIAQAKGKGERLFLSHLTSTTHHPWDLPVGNTHVQYLKQPFWRKEHELNRYLNTIRYVDNWIGEIMDMLNEMEVADETMVVLVGDHGMAFEEDSRAHTTYENGHISNMRVPLTFYHPSLPRMQLEVNATSLSIIPTILDLLVVTSSLDAGDEVIASELVQQYEGQSLIRPFVDQKNGRQAWNIAVLNAGGAVLSVSSAAVPFRLVMPICKPGAYRFTSNDVDPHELKPIQGNNISELSNKVASIHGINAGQWTEQAEKIGKYWVLEQRRRWSYSGASLQDDRRPEELLGAGAEKKMHWWDT